MNRYKVSLGFGIVAYLAFFRPLFREAELSGSIPILDHMIVFGVCVGVPVALTWLVSTLRGLFVGRDSRGRDPH